MKLAFMEGYPLAPESYWRLMPLGKHFRAPLYGCGRVLLPPLDVLWIHEPVYGAALERIREAKAMGAKVICDFSEDVWLRSEVTDGYPYPESADTARELADVLVATSPELAEAIGATHVLPPVLPLEGWTPREPVEPRAVGWWSDGRQKHGLEAVAASLGPVVAEHGCAFRHIQFPHQDPLKGVVPLTQQHLYMGGSSDGVELIMGVYRDALAECYVSLDCWPAGEYGRRASDLSILRAAALGVPTLSTREGPPGTITAPPYEWGEALNNLLTEPGAHRALSLAARAWAETRTSFIAFERLLTEV